MKKDAINKLDAASKLIAESLAELRTVEVIAPDEAVTATTESSIKNINVAIVVGHSDKRQGASNPDTSMTEYKFNLKVAKDIVARLNNDEGHSVGGVVVLRETTLRQLPDAVNATGAVLCLSLHCNAFNRAARGCETLYYHSSKKGLELAKLVQRELMELLDTTDRGIKSKSSEDRGGYMLRETNMPCVIAEPFFIDESNDFKIGMQHRKSGELAGAYTKAILNMVNNVL